MFYLFGSRATVMFSQRHFHLNRERDYICSLKICVFIYVPNGYVRLGLSDNLELDTASTYFFIFSLNITQTLSISLFILMALLAAHGLPSPAITKESLRSKLTPSMTLVFQSLHKAAAAIKDSQKVKIINQDIKTFKRYERKYIELI